MAELAAYGVLFKRGAVTVGQVSNITGPGLSLDTIEVTAHDSPSAFREFVAGLGDAGEVTVEMFFDPDNTGQASLRTDLTSRTSTSYSVTFPDPTPQVWTFTGFVTAFEPSAPVDGALTVSSTIKITGVVTVA